VPDTFCPLTPFVPSRLITATLKESDSELTLHDQIDANAWNEQMANWKTEPVRKFVEGLGDVTHDKILQSWMEIEVRFRDKDNRERMVSSMRDQSYHPRPSISVEWVK
jgi:hypothetical protein